MGEMIREAGKAVGQFEFLLACVKLNWRKTQIVSACDPELTWYFVDQHKTEPELSF
jgi:hypothetical protein